ncbi:YbaN family protein [Pseudobacteriovorax antillogorgiicola]|uniref:Inner membrane protein n=1 Tax=Pseudobacteriovorax antillogorgiicola TaxID=1513793 RepID=A0A1Y6B9F4_9BACT|nr:YbaN family protein [Pseudobacteriovorax antillogorgiicola]TCS58527.1 hypothetical protein EDD56_10240 [Pseudobacteriovorax antillogorgiicola]SME97937.1 hypothetical protein SAMN06296036_102403 [Pseudobacteriovorax antillogorgiicola]
MDPQASKNTRVDYSHEVTPIKNPILRTMLMILSFVFLGVGFVGVFLPVLPTTPFVLLSAFLYARSSPRFYNWMMNHRHLGPPLRRWKTTGSIPRSAKILAISMIAITLIPSILFVVPVLAVKVLLGIIGILVATYIATRPESDKVA